MNLKTLLKDWYPVLEFLKDRSFDEKDLLTEIQIQFPPDDPVMTSLKNAACQALEKGLICDKVNGSLRFSRLAKASPETHGFSLDAVYMPDCKGPPHTHPQGELSFCIPLDGQPSFEGCQKGWVLKASKSRHTPEVKGGSMLIFYFLPEGAMIWD